MELTRRATATGTELAVSGRLDSYWADHLKGTLEEAMRQGSHEITLDLAQVSYVSSAGIGVLAATYRKLSTIQGRLRIVKPSETVVRVLKLCGLSGLLLAAGEAPATAAARGAEAASVERDGVKYTSYDVEPGARLSWRVIGDPGRLEGSRFRAEDTTVVSLPATSTVVGLGAFGGEFDACRNRFGEFLAVAGTAAYLPSDSTGIPDYFVAAGSELPEVTLLYGVACDGPFARQLRFEAGEEMRGVSLSRLVDDCLSLAQADAAAVVVVAESAGLAGAVLRRSPAAGADPRAPFVYPEVRDWLSFSPERIHPDSVVVAAGVAVRAPSAALAAMVRPLGAEPFPAGHIHAAAFSYSPLPRGAVGLRETVAGLYQNERLQGVLHLLCDSRPITGAGESAFSRGACWIGPLQDAAGIGSPR